MTRQILPRRTLIAAACAAFTMNPISLAAVDFGRPTCGINERARDFDRDFRRDFRSECLYAGAFEDLRAGDYFHASRTFDRFADRFRGDPLPEVGHAISELARGNLFRSERSIRRAIRLDITRARDDFPTRELDCLLTEIDDHFTRRACNSREFFHLAVVRYFLEDTRGALDAAQEAARAGYRFRELDILIEVLECELCKDSKHGFHNQHFGR